MGGDKFSPPSSSTEEESVSQDFPHESIKSDFPRGDEEGLSANLEINSVINEEIGLNFEEFFENGSISEIKERQKLKVYAEVLRSYEELQHRIVRLKAAKNRLLRYTPGSFLKTTIEGKIEAKVFKTYDVPRITKLLLIGPKGSGKSSLVNKISRALDDDLLIPGRAQVSQNPSGGDGTFFLNEYKIPRGNNPSICLYDTRGLSDDLSENLGMLKPWMTKGVRHGEPIKRKSDSRDFKARLDCKARRRSCSSRVKAVNFVVFVLNGISVLESMNGDDEEKKRYFEMIATVFNDPLLSFKDDKPVVVVTHGDLLSLSERVRIRVYLGELLGVPPTHQIFDIPENNDAGTTLTIVDMLLYSLERADRNLPTTQELTVWQDLLRPLATGALITFVLLVMMRAISSILVPYYAPAAASTETEMEWRKIRHLWSE